MPSIAQLVLAAIAAVLLVSTSAVAQPAYCGVGPYNLTALQNGPDLIFDQSGVNGNKWALHPCGTVSTAGYCSSATSPASFCQGGNVVSRFNASAVGDVNQDYAGFGVGGNEPYWTLVTRGNQYGVAQIMADGASCNGIGARQGVMEFVCNPAATTAYISQVLETSACHYSATIQTNLVCSVEFNDAFNSGLAVQSTQCGGGLYDLNVLNMDIVDTADAVIIHPCGRVANATNPYCYSNGLSVCQYSGTSGNALATYSPYNYPTLYQAIPNGVSQVIQDGAPCGSIGRLVNISYICDATATTPVLTAQAESPICHYHYTIASAALCSQTRQTPAVTVPATHCAFGPFNLNSISNQTISLGTNTTGQFYNCQHHTAHTRAHTPHSSLPPPLSHLTPLRRMHVPLM